VPHITVEACTKFVPVTVSVKGVEPATALVEDSRVILGALRARLAGTEAAPLAFITVMLSGPAVASRAVGTVAVIELAVLAVTVNAVGPA
jgi:hypothetical protein